MTFPDHKVELEELMALLDGELTGAEAERVRTHVAGCRDCQRMEAEMRGVSGRLAAWQVEEAPESLAPRRRTRLASLPRWLPIAAGLVITAGAGTIWLSTLREAPRENLVGERAMDSGAALDSTALSYHERLQAPGAASPMALAQPELAKPAGGVVLVRTARLTVLVTGDFDAARASMERIVAAAGGYTGNIAIREPRGGARSLSATLRVPTAALDGALVALKQLGQVTSETQDGEDVTRQSVDLDARLSNARAAEVRLKEIMDKRTGKLADVLAVEQEIARVRGDIERMEADRKSLDRRITFALIAVELTAQRNAAMDLGPLPVSTRLRNALVDGWTAAVNSALETTIVAVRTAPVLTMWVLVLAFPAWMIRRRLTR